MKATSACLCSLYSATNQHGWPARACLGVLGHIWAPPAPIAGSSLQDVKAVGACLSSHSPAWAARVDEVGESIVSRGLLVLQAVEGVEVVWQGLPSPKGILMLFHGCRHSATDYFPKSDSCPACLGEACYPSYNFSSRATALHFLNDEAVSDVDALRGPPVPQVASGLPLRCHAL